MSAARRHVAADDEKAESPGLYVLFGLASLVLVALALALLIVPPALAAHLFILGARGTRGVWQVAGVALFAAWFAGLVLVGRRVMGPRATPPAA